VYNNEVDCIENQGCPEAASTRQAIGFTFVLFWTLLFTAYRSGDWRLNISLRMC
jgi:hypothetical protein